MDIQAYGVWDKDSNCWLTHNGITMRKAIEVKNFLIKLPVTYAYSEKGMTRAQKANLLRTFRARYEIRERSVHLNLDYLY